MPKRRKISSSGAITVNTPYSSNNGGRWLKKALDPADIDVELMGMPDTATNARAVLNYQMQADIPIPDQDTYIPTSVSSYDADLYVFQNPLIYGISVSYPQGTKDPSSGTIVCDFIHGKMTLSAGTAPRTVNVFVNDQIEGSNFYSKIANFTKYCQRYRMIYGGVQGIPACSALFDSGTIEATQQIFSPENSQISDLVKNRNINDPGIPDHLLGANQAGFLGNAPNFSFSNDGKIYKKQKFNLNDFPDSGNSIQNPAALYCRYKEGVYMPYKIRNPLVHEYLNSEERAVFEAPFVMTNQVYWAAGLDNSGTQSAISGSCDYDPATRTYSCLNIPSNDFTGCTQMSFFVKCFLKTGVPFWLRITQGAKIKDSNTVSVLGYATSVNPKAISLPQLINGYENTAGVYSTSDYTSNTDNQVTTNYEIWTTVRAFNATYGTNDEITQYPMYSLPFYDSNIGVINFKSIGIQASIRLIFRLGFEFMITAGGVYSPFKHKAPKYDARAISSYIKACHNMRDAFHGDAATPEGHLDYTRNINAITSSTVSNAGSSWYGRVSVL